MVEVPLPREVIVGPPNHKGELLWFLGEREVCWRRLGVTRSRRGHAMEGSQGDFHIK